MESVSNVVFQQLGLFHQDQIFKHQIFILVLHGNENQNVFLMATQLHFL